MIESNPLLLRNRHSSTEAMPLYESVNSLSPSHPERGEGPGRQGRRTAAEETAVLFQKSNWADLLRW
jgi:hypothetical protein